MELTICHLYPDLLNLYGDRGNVTTLAHRLACRGIGVTVLEAPLDTCADLTRCDILFLGGGQDADQLFLLDELRSWRGAEIAAAIADGVVTLAICGGYQLLGHSYQPMGGEPVDFLGILDVTSVGVGERIVGDILFSWDELGAPLNIVGFENHGAKTYLGGGVTPFGRVLAGCGNNGDGTEGARYQNVFATYSHGPLLPKNPVLADHLLTLALARKYGGADLSPLDDTLEQRANQFMVSRLLGSK